MDCYSILVTGASGFIGGAIAYHLIKQGYFVQGLNRRQSKQRGLEFIEVDITRNDFVEFMIRKSRPFDVIIHAAAALPQQHDITIAATNCLGVQQVLSLAKAWKVKKFIYLSSLPVIGVPQKLPINEEHVTKPQSTYHVSKLYGEYVVGFARKDGIKSNVLRITSPVGFGMPSNRIFSTFVKNALINENIVLEGKGGRCQNYVDVRDISKAVEYCLEKEVEGIFNIGGCRSFSNIELAKLCIDTLNSSSIIKYSGKVDDDELLNWDVSIDKAMSHLGYYPQYVIKDSILTVGEYFANSNHE